MNCRHTVTVVFQKNICFIFNSFNYTFKRYSMICRNFQILYTKLFQFPDIMKSVMDAIGQASEKCQQIYETMATDPVNINQHLETLGVFDL